MFLSLKDLLTSFTMVKKDDFWGALFGLFLGAVGLVVVTEALKPKCPTCDKSIEKGTPLCPHCGSLLGWGY
jgi:hypothetical protein